MVVPEKGWKVVRRKEFVFKYQLHLNVSSIAFLYFVTVLSDKTQSLLS